jgi:hypothetical protein
MAIYRTRITYTVIASCCIPVGMNVKLRIVQSTLNFPDLE